MNASALAAAARAGPGCSRFAACPGSREDAVGVGGAGELRHELRPVGLAGVDLLVLHAVEADGLPYRVEVGAQRGFLRFCGDTAELRDHDRSQDAEDDHDDEELDQRESS